MFRKLTLPAVLLLAAVAGAPATSSGTMAAPAAQTAAMQVESVPLAPLAVQSAAPEAVQLAPAQMQQAQGEGWLKKLFKKLKKLLRKIIDVIIDYLLDQLFSETNTWVATQVGDVTETHESTETTTTYYASQANYDAGISSGSTYESTPYVMTSRTYSAGPVLPADQQQQTAM